MNIAFTRTDVFNKVVSLEVAQEAVGNGSFEGVDQVVVSTNTST
jgi:hypothetical protein